MSDENFRHLPTTTLTLDKDFRILSGTKRQIEKNYEEYYLAVCHFVLRDDERQYYLQKDKIQRLVLLKKDDEEGYPHYAAKIWHYGVPLN